MKEEARFATRVARAILGTGNFTMSFGGTADVAGHGNFVEDSYPLVFRDLIEPVFRAAGVEQFVVRNMAMGGVWSSYPHSLCLGTMLGDDADVVVWDFHQEHEPFLSELYLRQVL
jgi:hypothetical protein